MTEYYKKMLGGTVFLRGDLGPHCSDDGCMWVGENLCDFPVGNGKTCDRLLCEDHINLVGPDLHYCKAHFQEWEKFVKENGVSRVLENVVPFKEL